MFECLRGHGPAAYCVWCDAILDEAGELFLVRLLVLLHQVGHVVGHIHAHDVFAMHFCVELFALCVITGEALQTGNKRERRGLATVQQSQTLFVCGHLLKTFSPPVMVLFMQHSDKQTVTQ